MALNDAAALAVDTGDYYLAPVGTTMPTDLRNPGAAWTKVGHSTLEDILSIESDGGDTTVLGTLQNKSLRTRRSPRQETFNISIHQFDELGQRLYYGANAQVIDGTITRPTDPRPTVTAFLATFIDGDQTYAFYIPRCEILGGDDLEFEDTESLVALPLAITPLQYQTNKYLYRTTILGLPPELWTAETAYTAGDKVSLSTGEVLEATNTGESGTTEPVAPENVGDQIVDATITWQRTA